VARRAYQHEFGRKSKMNFIDHLICLLLHGGMRPSDGASTEAGALFVEVDNVRAIARAKRPLRARFEETCEKSAPVVIVYSLFLALIGAALLVGGHAMIDWQLQPAIAAREAMCVGEVISQMPGGIFCRQMSFDNATAEVTEHAIERCQGRIARELAVARKGFVWGGH